MLVSSAAEEMRQWSHEQALAERFALAVTQLNRLKGVLIRIKGRVTLGGTANDMIIAHRAADLDLQQTVPVLEGLLTQAIKPCRLDVGRILSENINLDGEIDAANAQNLPNEAQDVVLYGFGRIGRLMARNYIERSGPAALLNLRAVVCRPSKDPKADLRKRASLLRTDSIHGAFNATIEVDEDSLCLIANGNRIQFIYAPHPAGIDYGAFGIKNAILIDNTGVWSDEAGLGQHLSAKGVEKVLLTAPAKGDVPNIVFGVNDEAIADQKIISAASCTTNASTPVLKVLDEAFGIVQGHIETVHSFTNDQNLIDNFHKADRRGRSAALNMVITSTGAAKAVAKAYPPLAGKLTGNAIRVPTPNVSLAILNLTLSRQTTVDAVNDLLEQASISAIYQKQIGFRWSTELVSSDLVGSRHAGVIDGAATIVEGQRAVVYVWYDNEFGYAQQVFRVAQAMAGIRLATLPA
ncbi:glyceraldehyde-3-phosphate dehydrogenase [Alphaproteobacteria bacterium]|nr:glyceraldehyde-3-phosphate dehydrogenase [Alphaproteobacteria bacterium]